MVSLLFAGLSLSAPPTIVAYDGLVIAVRSGKAWASPEGRLKPMPFAVPVSTVGFGVVQRNAEKISKIIEGDGVGGLWLEGPSDLHSVVSTNATATVPRPVSQLSNSNSAYVAVVAKTLKSRGITAATVNLTRVLRTDLDGDGRQDVLIEATNIEGDNWPEPETKRGQYSVVILRTETRSGVKQFDLLVTPTKETLADMNRIRAVADFDGDGVMEFVTSSNYYEGISGCLWRMKGGKVVKLAENGAGA